MREWLYKAREIPGGDRRRPDFDKTRAFAVEDGILCRSARNVNGDWIPHVQSVHAGDVIHFFFRPQSASVRFIGSFRVEDPGAGQVEGSHLARVESVELAQRLRDAYDMQSGAEVTGWLIKLVQGVHQPSVDEPDVAKFVQAQPTLTEYHSPPPASEAIPKDHVVTSVSAQLPWLPAPLRLIHGPLLVTIETWSDGTVVARFPAGRIYGEAEDDAAALEALAERIAEFVETHLLHALAGKLGGTLAKQWAVLTAMIDVSAVRISTEGMREVG